jgi:hypothetical protein
VWNGYKHTACVNNGKHEHNGQMWCGIHHPPTVAKKRAVNTTKMRNEWNRRMESQRSDTEARAEQASRAACFDDLLAALENVRMRLLQEHGFDVYVACELDPVIAKAKGTP